MERKIEEVGERHKQDEKERKKEGNKPQI